MAKENKKVNVIIICSSKGGEGKTMLSVQKIPLLFLRTTCRFPQKTHNLSNFEF